MSDIFYLRLEVDAVLRVEDIWPDGDAPADPTVDDIRAVLHAAGHPLEVADDWGMNVGEWEVTT